MHGAGAKCAICDCVVCWCTIQTELSIVYKTAGVTELSEAVLFMPVELPRRPAAQHRLRAQRPNNVAVCVQVHKSHDDTFYIRNIVEIL